MAGMATSKRSPGAASANPRRPTASTALGNQGRAWARAWIRHKRLVGRRPGGRGLRAGGARAATARRWRGLPAESAAERRGHADAPPRARAGPRRRPLLDEAAGRSFGRRAWEECAAEGGRAAPETLLSGLPSEKVGRLFEVGLAAEEVVKELGLAKGRGSAEQEAERGVAFEAGRPGGAG
ncbi:unnamed protein product [Prorocentrum cordatum]|uniref:Uncharacterized protein n=1 Tax=Prorocentrum cordatum TaxID=2364126 RepID=A0ABN9PBU2_9DINO|nr:unnamed protein product [Polarella glacialis]